MQSAKREFQLFCDTGELDWFSVGSVLWKKAVKIIGVGDKNHPAQLLGFSLILQTSSTSALKNIAEQVNF